jgi:hypothetical protein
VRTPQTLEVAAGDNAETICQRMQLLLENGNRVIYLRVKSDRLSDLCATISYLTDAGIDTDVGMVYPMITDIQTIYANDLKLKALPIVQITIRPI